MMSLGAKGILLVSSLFFLAHSTLSYAHCEPVKEVANIVAKKAYNQNLMRALVETAKRNKVPIVYREATEASQALQQNGFPTKRLELKNKSSLLPHIEGFIPFNGFAGKKGDKYKEFVERHCNGHPHTCSAEKKPELEHLEQMVQLESETILGKLSKKNADGNLHYTKVPMVRQNNSQLEVVVYTDQFAHGTKWVPLTGPLPENTAWVMGDINGKPITADTDLVFIGQPLNGNHVVTYDPQYGFRTEFDDKIRNELNGLWDQYSENTNQIIQHGDEANFGLNSLDDMLVAIGHDGVVKKFDLRVGVGEEAERNRAKALRAYAHWLVQESKTSDILLPTHEIQKSRRNSLGKVGAAFDFTEARKDYDVIERVFKERNAHFARTTEQSMKK